MSTYSGYQICKLATRHVFVKHGCPPRQQSQTMAKISKSYILTLPHPQGHVMSVKCEQPLDELTVQVWLLYDHPHFKYCTLFISGTELQTDGRTDDPNTRCPRRTFQAGGTKKKLRKGPWWQIYIRLVFKLYIYVIDKMFSFRNSQQKLVLMKINQFTVCHYPQLLLLVFISSSVTYKMG